MNYEESIAGNIRAELARRQITNREIAEMLGLSAVSAGKRVNGCIEWRTSEIDKIARHLNMRTEDLLKANEYTHQGV